MTVLSQREWFTPF